MAREGVKKVLRETIKGHEYGVVAETASLFREFFDERDSTGIKEAVLAMRTFLDRLERACRADADRAEERKGVLRA